MPYRRGMIRQHGGELSILQRMLDAVIIIATLWLSATSYGVTLNVNYELAAMVAVVGFLFFAEWHALYVSWRADSLRREGWVILSMWILCCSAMFALGFLSKTSIYFSRVTIFAWALSTPFVLIGERVILRHILSRFRLSGFNSRSVAIVGDDKNADLIKRAIIDSPWRGLHVHGVYDDVSGTQTAQTAGHIQGDIDALLNHVQEGNIDCVYIAYPMQQQEKIRRLVERLADSTVSVHIVPDVFVSDLLRARWTSLGEIPLVSVYESPIYGANQFLKRLEDMILGAVILLLISPVLLMVSVAVKLTSSGPILFKQRRYGLNGQIIEVWKFRSMSVTEDGAHVPQAQKNDPRITPLGAILRRTSLDELPQFINVLQGRMSIVGPRPHAVAHNEQYRKLIHGYMLRHMVKPGITGWAQVNGWRGETDTIEKMAKRVQYDLYYINNWSLWLDLKIILMTVFGGMRGQNAY